MNFFPTPGTTYTISRCAHSDIPKPNFDKYRKTHLKNTKNNENTSTATSTDDSRAEVALVTLGKYNVPREL